MDCSRKFHFSWRTYVAGALLFACVLLPARGATARPQESGPPPLDEWLVERDHAEIKWRVEVSRPLLTFAERQLVSVAVRIPREELRESRERGDLHLAVRVADAAGHWLVPAETTDVVLPPGADRKLDVRISTAAHCRPGRYTFAIVLFGERGQRSVAHRAIEVRPLHNDPLPRLEDNLPPVQFLSTDPAQRAEKAARLSLPLLSGRPLLVDVIINFSPSSQYEGRRGVYRLNSAVFLQVMRVLAQLRPSNGCVYLTGLDVNGMRVLFERENAQQTQPARLVNAVRTMDPTLVDVNTLEHRKQAADFFRDVVERMFVQRSPWCITVAGRPPLHAYVVVGSGMVFEAGTRIHPSSVNIGCDARVYRMRGTLLLGDVWDDLKKVISNYKPRTLVISTPGEFRKSLADLIDDLQRATAASAPGC